ncbi:hypothetical protein [Fusobacterium sp.]|uniref:hypothetical protein n=1 Tax=Fusobacterium sp. TaxID=68766 RepID=UPI00260D3F8E|nr:hypothetical protein [Fusobacterium sp.]
MKKIILILLMIFSINTFSEVTIEKSRSNIVKKNRNYNLILPKIRLNGEELDEINDYIENKVSKEYMYNNFTLRDSNILKHDNNFGITSIELDFLAINENLGNYIKISNFFNIDSKTGKLLKFSDVFTKVAKEKIKIDIISRICNLIMTDDEFDKMLDEYLERNKYSKNDELDEQEVVINSLNKIKVDEIKDAIENSFYFSNDYIVIRYNGVNYRYHRNVLKEYFKKEYK